MTTLPIEASYRYLVVDDSSFSRLVMQISVEKGAEQAESPCVCDCAASGPEAVELCKQHEYDLIIMDYNMPEMTGGVAARKILALDPHAHIVGYTATTELEELADCFLSGMVEVLPKDPRRISQVVKSQMTEHASALSRKNSLD
ncbi:MAG TPA: response regulator [Rhabdochlamydiaceae bacterium]